MNLRSLMNRRLWFKRGTQLLGGLFGVALGVPAASYVIDPRNRPAAPGALRRVARLSELDVNVPKQAMVRDIRQDAWTLHPNDVLGRVWLIRRDTSDGTGVPVVEAYTTICPHLGCSINFVADSARPRFVCPCHGGTFHLSCERVGEEELGRANPAPRGMDSLEVQLEEIPGDKPGEKDYAIAVKYENFIQGRDDKVKKS